MDISHVTWRKASYSGDNGGGCVEVGVWRKSSHSGDNGGACVEVASTGKPLSPSVTPRTRTAPNWPLTRPCGSHLFTVLAGPFPLSRLQLLQGLVGACGGGISGAVLTESTHSAEQPSAVRASLNNIVPLRT